MSSTGKVLADDDEEGLAPFVARHYNLIEEKGVAARAESKIFHMRSFNNWIKSMLIKNTIEELRRAGVRNCKVLDMCCGKGGDIQKWLKSGQVSHVTFADIAETSVQQCKERYESVVRNGVRQSNKRRRREVFTAEFVTADCTKDSLSEMYQDPNLEFDIVSIQFSFHYCFESISQAMKMLENVATNLKTGGMFIGTLPDANEIVKRYQQEGNNGFGNRIYTIQIESEEPYPEFGAKYFFQLEECVNCPEFLVHFPIFQSLAAKFGLRLLYQYSFRDYFRDKMLEGLDLLKHMKGLEIFRRNKQMRSTNQKRHPEEYADAEAFLRENPRYDEVMTLSKSEWEAVGLYVVFAFEKTADFI